jgi:predicted nucleic acid-binding protein
MILAEYAEVTDRLQARYPDRKPVRWASALGASAELVFPNVRLRGVTPDPDDEMFLECAVAGEAHFLVTGDKRHLQSLVEVRSSYCLTSRFPRNLAGRSVKQLSVGPHDRSRVFCRPIT